MCGIAGIVGQHQSDSLSRMNAVLYHRGPDDSGEYHDPENEVSLGMRRLSILDLSAGHQPMSDPKGDLWIIFNGEIYNAPELRDELSARGRKFVTNNSDTEVLLHLYAEKQHEMLSQLNGMFGFVIYDKRRRQLFGARDRIGIKPLYYYQRANSFAFASEMKALLTLPEVERKLDLQSAFHYMTLLHVPGEASIIDGIKRLPPGCWFKFDLESRQLTVEPYWKLNTGEFEDHSEDEWCALIRNELRAAVKRWTLSDVPIGCSLSGGIDSTTVVGLLRELNFNPIKTYSLGFVGEGESEWDELGLARSVAQRWETQHHEITIQPEELLDDLVQMVWYLDEPYGGGLPSWYVFRLMAEDVKVGLTGSGGDELFGNYGKFHAFEVSPLMRAAFAHPGLTNAGQHLPRSVWHAWRSVIEALPGSILSSERKRRLSELDKLCEAPFGQYYYANQVYFSDRVKRETVFRTNGAAISDTAAYLQHLYELNQPTNTRDAIAQVDFQTQLPDEFLLMTDRFSMAHSLEARVPFLDHELVEKVFRIPAAMRTRPDNLKYLLKKSVADLIPDEVLHARKKGFVMPIKLWLRGQLRPLVERLLAPERLEQQKIFRASFYASYVTPHLEGRADFTWQIWAALMFQLWHLIFIEQRSVAKPTYSWRELI